MPGKIAASMNVWHFIYAMLLLGRDSSVSNEFPDCPRNSV